MSSSIPCDLEEVMRSLSISSPSQGDVVGGAENQLEVKLSAGAVDNAAEEEVFLDGAVAEVYQGERSIGFLKQQELMDSTDALLMDATNKMDDTAFLDEVIARNCKSYGSTDDDYIDEVIAR